MSTEHPPPEPSVLVIRPEPFSDLGRDNDAGTWPNELTEILELHINFARGMGCLILSSISFVRATLRLISRPVLRGPMFTGPVLKRRRFVKDRRSFRRSPDVHARS